MRAARWTSAPTYPSSETSGASRVQPDPHLHRTGRESLGQLGGGGKSRGRSFEGEEERVALRIDLDAVVAVTRLTYDSPVRGKCPRVTGITQFVQELRGPLDVGEEERDGPGR